MVRSQNLLHAPPLAHSPLSFSALSVNGACPDPVGVLRKTRSLTQIDPSAPLLSHRHSPDAAIPFRITSFADPHHLTPIESHLCKKWGRGWGIQRFHHTQALPLSSTASKHPAAHSNARISTLFTRLLHSSLDTRGVGRPRFKSKLYPHLRLLVTSVQSIFAKPYQDKRLQLPLESMPMKNIGGGGSYC